MFGQVSNLEVTHLSVASWSKAASWRLRLSQTTINLLTRQTMTRRKMAQRDIQEIDLII